LHDQLGRIVQSVFTQGSATSGEMVFPAMSNGISENFIGVIPFLVLPQEGGNACAKCFAAVKHLKMARIRAALAVLVLGHRKPDENLPIYRQAPK